jgi:hypothetical protein
LIQLDTLRRDTFLRGMRDTATTLSTASWLLSVLRIISMTNDEPFSEAVQGRLLPCLLLGAHPVNPMMLPAIAERNSAVSLSLTLWVNTAIHLGNPIPSISSV